MLLAAKSTKRRRPGYRQWAFWSQGCTNVSWDTGIHWVFPLFSPSYLHLPTSQQATGWISPQFTLYLGLQHVNSVSPWISRAVCLHSFWQLLNRLLGLFRFQWFQNIGTSNMEDFTSRLGCQRGTVPLIVWVLEAVSYANSAMPWTLIPHEDFHWATVRLFFDQILHFIHFQAM